MLTLCGREHRESCTIMVPWRLCCISRQRAERQLWARRKILAHDCNIRGRSVPNEKCVIWERCGICRLGDGRLKQECEVWGGVRFAGYVTDIHTMKENVNMTVGTLVGASMIDSGKIIMYETICQKSCVDSWKVSWRINEKLRDMPLWSVSTIVGRRHGRLNLVQKRELSRRGAAY